MCDSKGLITLSRGDSLSPEKREFAQDAAPMGLAEAIKGADVFFGLSVAGVLTSAVLERRAEVALMQAIGASRESVLLLFLSEGAVLGLAGGLLAAATGSFLGQWLVRAVF